MVNERDFTLDVQNEKVEATIKGKTDHTIHLLSSDVAALTLEDKCICSVFTKEVAQVEAQINFEVGVMENHLNYVPEQYVGLLQNGIDWITVYYCQINVSHVCVSCIRKCCVNLMST